MREDEIERDAIAQSPLHPVHLLPACSRVCRNDERRFFGIEGIGCLSSRDIKGICDVFGGIGRGWGDR